LSSAQREKRKALLGAPGSIHLRIRFSFFFYFIFFHFPPFNFWVKRASFHMISSPQFIIIALGFFTIFHQKYSNISKNLNHKRPIFCNQAKPDRMFFENFELQMARFHENWSAVRRNMNIRGMKIDMNCVVCIVGCMRMEVTCF
jgi:hypothetical protein